MCLILKEQQPILLLTLNVDLDLNSTSVYLLRLIKLGKLSVCLKISGCNSCNIHKIDGLGSSKLASDSNVLIVRLLKKLVLKLNAVDGGKEGGMTAVIRPIRIDHLDLSYSRISVLGTKIVAAESYIIKIHSKSVIVNELSKLLILVGDKAVEHLDLGGYLIVHLKRVAGVERSLTALNGVDNVLLDSCYLLLAKISKQAVNSCGANHRTLATGDYLDTLSGRVSSLVELTGEIFNSKDSIVFSRLLVRNDIKLRLGEYGRYRIIKKGLFDVLNIISIIESNVLELLDANETSQLA